MSTNLLDGWITETVASVTDYVSEQHGLIGGDVWREDPVSMQEFVESPEHLGLTRLFDRQMAAVVATIGLDPKRIFDEPDADTPDARQFQLAVLLWGKGSGKDYVCSIIVTYLVYVLLCLRDPQAYFEFGRGEPIDIINVAYNADQAKRVFFEKLKQRLLGWAWLRDNYNLVVAGRLIGPRKLGQQDVEINDGEVLFPRQIRCFSRHSQNESYEGYNIIAWVMDEASAFLSKLKRENADNIYQTLRTSAASRFQRRWVGFIISYPRHGDDFTMTKLAEARRDPSLGIYADGPATTWEINERLGRGQFVETRPGHLVPIELANDYTLDYEAALSRYECQPPAARDAFIRFPEHLDNAVTDRAPLIEWEEIVTRREVVRYDDALGEDVRTVREFSAVRLTKLGKLPRGARLFLHGDPGITSDSFALAIGHGVPAKVRLLVPAIEVLSIEQIKRHGLTPETLVPWWKPTVRVVIDGLIVWRPDQRYSRQVDILNVKDILLELRAAYRLQAVTFDHFSSYEIVQALQAKRVPVDNEMWSGPFQLDMFRQARTAFYNDLVDLPNTPSITSTDALAPGALYEFKRLELIEGRKIDHPADGSKDCADAVARVIQHVFDASQGGLTFGTVQGHQEGYVAKTGVAPSATKKVDPNNPDSPTESWRTSTEAREKERPYGEVLPAEGKVRGLAYAAINGRNGR